MNRDATSLIDWNASRALLMLIHFTCHKISISFDWRDVSINDCGIISFVSFAVNEERNGEKENVNCFTFFSSNPLCWTEAMCCCFNIYTIHCTSFEDFLWLYIIHTSQSTLMQTQIFMIHFIPENIFPVYSLQVNKSILRSSEASSCLTCQHKDRLG